MGLLGLHETVESISASGKPNLGSRWMLFWCPASGGGLHRFWGFYCVNDCIRSPVASGVPASKIHMVRWCSLSAWSFSYRRRRAFTGNAMFMTVSYLRREIRLQDLAGGCWCGSVISWEVLQQHTFWACVVYSRASRG